VGLAVGTDNLRVGDAIPGTKRSATVAARVLASSWRRIRWSRWSSQDPNAIGRPKPSTPSHGTKIIPADTPLSPAVAELLRDMARPRSPDTT
jgi:hypothetical protein